MQRVFLLSFSYKLWSLEVLDTVPLILLTDKFLFFVFLFFLFFFGGGVVLGDLNAESFSS